MLLRQRHDALEEFQFDAARRRVRRGSRGSSSSASAAFLIARCSSSKKSTSASCVTERISAPAMMAL